jgi:hypothetical protein
MASPCPLPDLALELEAIVRFQGGEDYNTFFMLSLLQTLF